eukprot:7513668-Ditylum_brightwellii.AAC.1
MLDSNNFDGCPGTAPTMAPSPFSCSSDEDIMEVRIKTDQYPTETAWILTNTCSSAVVAEAPAGTYTSSNTEYSDKICVPPGGAYSFFITDSFGDGICCSYGEGFYNVLKNDVSMIGG